jgi:hypothetical protein
MTRNDHAIKLINALTPCGADLRRVLLALAGEVNCSENPNSSAMPPDGTRWHDEDYEWEVRGGQVCLSRLGRNEWSRSVCDPIDLDRAMKRGMVRTTPPAAAPSPARTELEAAAADLCDLLDVPTQTVPCCEAIARVRAALKNQPAPSPNMPDCVRELVEVCEWLERDSEIAVGLERSIAAVRSFYGEVQ